MTMRDDDLSTRTGGSAGLTDEDDPSAIERDIERTRADMSETLEAIQQKLSPSHLVDQALGYFTAGPGTVMTNFSEIAMRNPIPLTLIGLGIGWVAIAGLRSGSGSGRIHYGDAAGYQGQSGYKSGGGSMSGIADSARDAASRAYSSVREGASNLAGQAASHVDTDRMSGIVNRATAPVLGLGETQPLLLGAIGLAIGAALGAAFPATRMENRLMGTTRDDLVRRARDMGEEQLHKVQSAAQRTMEAVREEVGNAGLTPAQAAESLTEKVTRVAEAGYEAAKEELKKES